jgi:hypothetical protein
MCERDKKCKQICCKNPEGKMSLQTPWHSWESTMKIDPKGMEYACMKYITFVRNRSHMTLGGWPYVNCDESVCFVHGWKC